MIYAGSPKELIYSDLMLPIHAYLRNSKVALAMKPRKELCARNLESLKMELTRFQDDPEKASQQRRALELEKILMWDMVLENRENDPILLPLLKVLGIPTPVKRPSKEESRKAYNALFEEGFRRDRSLRLPQASESQTP